NAWTLSTLQGYGAQCAHKVRRSLSSSEEERGHAPVALPSRTHLKLILLRVILQLGQPPLPGHFVDEADEQHLEPEQRPEGGFGRQRPKGAQPAPEQSFASLEILSGGGQLKLAPTAAEDFDVVFAPARVRFTGPALFIQAQHQPVHPVDAIDVVITPKVEPPQRFTGVLWAQWLGPLEGRLRRGPQPESPLITRPTPGNRLEETQQRHQRPRPHAPAVLRQFGLARRRHADRQGYHQACQRQREQEMERRRQGEQ